jgi:DNA invertase Pin-like site-specific DNA recombinase
MLTIKYLRTSTLAQHGNRFKLDQFKYDKVIKDLGVSGKIPFAERTGGAELLSLVQQKKVSKIVFPDASRIGRTLLDSIKTLDYLIEQNNVVVKLLDIGIESHKEDGTRNPLWGIVTNLLLSIYQMERERILELTEMGRKQYVLAGGKLGRPIGWRQSDKDFLNKPKVKSIMKFIQMGKSTRDIKSRLNCGTSTIAKVRKLMKGDNCNEENHIEKTTSKISANPPNIVVEQSVPKVSENPPQLKIKEEIDRTNDGNNMKFMENYNI